MQQNTPAFVTLSPAPITMTISLMTMPFSTQLDCLSPFTCCLLYATILESTTAYQAFHALPYFSANDTLTQLTILFRIYSTLCTLFTRATWCLAGAPNPFQTATAQESPIILALEQCLLEPWKLTLNLLYIKGFNYTISLLPSPIIDVVLSSIILSLSESEQLTFYADHPLPTGLPWAYWAATTFSNSSLTINISWSSLTNGDNTVSGNSPQRVDSNATLIPTIPSIPTIPTIPTIPSTSAIIPPSNPHLPDSLPFFAPYAGKVPSYLLPGWPLPPPPAMFTPHWEQLQNGALHLPPILWNPF